MATFGTVLEPGDAVLVRNLVDPSASDLDAVVVQPVSISGGHRGACVLLDVCLPDGRRERREVAVDQLRLRPTRTRRGCPAPRLGEEDGWGEVASRMWRTAAAASTARLDEDVEGACAGEPIGSGEEAPFASDSEDDVDAGDDLASRYWTPCSPCPRLGVQQPIRGFVAA